MTATPPVVHELARELRASGWVTDLLVAGSLATGDHVPGVSDLDLVAVVDGGVDPGRRAALVVLHRALDRGSGVEQRLGCVYVDAALLLEHDARHPTWTHGAMVERVLSGVTRAELVRHAWPVFGRSPGEVLPPVNDDDVREAARAELAGYWAYAAARPLLWLDPAFADLGLTSMARGRHALATGRLLTKTAAIEQAAAPGQLVDDLRARRRGEDVRSPRLTTALCAWRDARRTVALARRSR